MLPFSENFDLDWPTLKVRWPPEGTTDLSTTYQAHRVISGRPGHPYQLPCIQVWIEIFLEEPRWLRFCFQEQLRKTKPSSPKEVLQKSSKDLDLPSPDPSAPQAPSSPSMLKPSHYNYIYIPFSTSDFPVKIRRKAKNYSRCWWLTLWRSSREIHFPFSSPRLDRWGGNQPVMPGSTKRDQCSH